METLALTITRTVSATIASYMLVVGVAVLTPEKVLAQPKPIVWNLPHLAPPSHYHIINLNAFATKVRERSRGKMEIRIHPASSLYPAAEIIPAVLDGRVEIAPVLSTYLSDVMLEMGVLELPFMTNGPEQHRKAAEQLRPFYTRMMARHGLKLLGLSSWPELHLYSHQPIRTVEEWKGKKIRVFGSNAAELVRVMGGAPMLISFGELYSALGKKVVDGAITSPSNAEPMKFFEVVKYINYWFLNGSSLEWLAVNQKAWNALPKDLQQVVVDSLKEIQYEDKEWGDNKAFEDHARQRVQVLGMTVIDPTPDEIEKARKRSSSVRDIWLQRTGKEGKEALDIALKALGRTQ